MHDEFTGKGIFPARISRRLPRSVRPQEVIGAAPSDAPNKSRLLADYRILHEEVHAMFKALSDATEKDPTQLATVPFQGIEVTGGRYINYFGTERAEVLCIEPECFRTVLKPHLEALQAKKKASKTVKPITRSNDYVGLLPIFPNSFGFSRLRLAIMSKLQEQKKNGGPPPSDGVYDLEIDNVAFKAKSYGANGCTILKDDIPALARLGLAYDQEHIAYLQEQGKAAPQTAVIEKWQALISRAQAQGNGRG